MPTLVLETDAGPQRSDLPDRPFVVGRSVECDLQLVEERASRRHFELQPTPRGWELVDLESSNGTAVNGYAVSRALLQPDDEIEVGGALMRFEADGPVAARAPRPPRKRPSSGPAWLGAMIAVLAVAVITDHLVAQAAESRVREVDQLRSRMIDAELAFALRLDDPVAAEAALEEFVAAYDGRPEAVRARERLETIRSGRESRDAALADLSRLEQRRAGLTPDEYRWRLEAVVRRWADDAEAIGALRRALEAGRAAAPSEDARVLFQRHKEQADDAVGRGQLGLALAVWTTSADALSVNAMLAREVREAVKGVETLAARRAQEAVDAARRFANDGRTAEATDLLRRERQALGDTSGGVRLEAMLARGLDGVRVPSGAAASRGPRPASPGGRDRTEAPESEATYARKRALYLEANEAEQFVALRDYDEAARRYRAVASSAADLADVNAEMVERAEELEGVAALLGVVRDLRGGYKGGAFPATWDQVPAPELVVFMKRARRSDADRLVIASFAWDQGLVEDARAVIAEALAAEATHDAAERLYARREGLAVPEGGFVADKGEIISKAEWKRRRNAERIGSLHDRQTSLMKKLAATKLVRSIDRLAEMRADLDQRRQHALDLIFDEITYFYPYRDRMKEYTPVQAEVDKRVDAVRELWDKAVKVAAVPDRATQSILDDLDEVATELGQLGAEPSAADAELARLRPYFGQELTLRNFFKTEEERQSLEASAAVMESNATIETVAQDPEREQVRITNEYRLMFGRKALTIADKLVLSARAHGDDMSRGGFFSHFNERLRGMKPGDEVPEQACGCSSKGIIAGCSHGPDRRIAKQEYTFMACSENIHMGSGAPEGAHRGWIHSSGHHRNLLNSAWKDMGTGQVGRYWTQNFGLPVDTSWDTGGGGSRWDDAGGRGNGGDGNDPR